MVGVIITIIPYIIALGLFLLLIYGVFALVQTYRQHNNRSPP